MNRSTRYSGRIRWVLAVASTLRGDNSDFGFTMVARLHSHSWTAVVRLALGRGDVMA
jgi:hypothetical protein